ncbi:MAG: type I phosphomannose isomerase catalytic subunit [Candidatus Aenigmatarchaeota archaeon]
MTRTIPSQKLKDAFIKPFPELVELVWGGNRIERIKGLKSSGKKIGESWECSSHPNHASEVIANGQSFLLPNIVKSMPNEILGKHVAEEFGELPMLVKLIDANDNLSVQVHPSDKKAAELGETQSGKNEFWVVLDADENSVLYLGFKKDVDKRQFESDLNSRNVNIAEKYLNAIHVKPGDLVFNPAGTAHAIGKGIVLAEIQQSSGLTYRLWDWNRVPIREMHVEKGLKSLDFTKTNESNFRKMPHKMNQNEESLIDGMFFSVDRITLDKDNRIDLKTNDSFQIVLCLQGNAVFVCGKAKEVLRRGESLLVPASLKDYSITASEKTILLKSFLVTPKHINPVIFQTYDVRETSDKLPDRVAYYLGKGYGTFLRKNNASENLWASVGGGIRLTTERVRTSLIKGLVESGVNVYDIGTTTTPELYFSIPYLNSDGGINITASHNAAEYNGLKQVIKKEGFICSINAQEMLEIKKIVLGGNFLKGNGKCVKILEGEVPKYHNELVKANCRLGRDIWIFLLKKWKGNLKALIDAVSGLDFPERRDEKKWEEIKKRLELPAGFKQPQTAITHPLKGLKLFIDFGNGSCWRTKKIFTDLGVSVIAMNETPDGSFPAHVPDPIKEKYRRQLETAVKETKSGKEVVGIGFDEDGDRVIYVRRDGRVVEGDRTLAIQAKSIIEEHRRKGNPGKPRFIGEVKFSRMAEEFITECGGEFIMVPTGFAFIKEAAKKIDCAIAAGANHADVFGKKIDIRRNREPVALAAELSGHQMSGYEENWMFDDAALAATKVLSIIAKALDEGKSFMDLDEEIPRYSSSPELNIRLPTNVLAKKQEVVDKIISVFRKKGFHIDTTDGGIIVWYKNGTWIGQALARKSNTQPMLVCRVEGRDEKIREMIEKEFFAELARISTKSVPKLDLLSEDYIRHRFNMKN